jgi:hypothetical protein
MVRTLRAMSTGQRLAKSVSGKDVKMWELDMSTVKSWCEETQIADYNEVAAALGHKKENGNKNGTT